MMDFINTFWNTHSQEAKDFFNSNFVTTACGALIGALFGALFGAKAAQRIAERSKAREELTKEIRTTNAAVMVAATISNSLLSLKKQHLKKLKGTFDQKHQEFLAIQQSKAENKRFEVVFDFETLKLPLLPLEVLQKQLFENLSVGGRALAIMTILNQSADALGAAIEGRNQLISQFKTDGLAGERLIPIYFGIRQQSGVTDQRYSATLDAIYSYTNDGIFFLIYLPKI